MTLLSLPDFNKISTASCGHIIQVSVWFCFFVNLGQSFDQSLICGILCLYFRSLFLVKMTKQNAEYLTFDEVEDVADQCVLS